MNTLIEQERIAETGRRLKLERVRLYGDSADEKLCDLPAAALAVRGGRQVAQVWQGAGPESARIIVYYACLAFDADEVFLVSDMLMRRIPPGQPDEAPELGEYQRLWASGAREGLSEALAVYRLPKDGRKTLHAYLYTREGRNIRWERGSQEIKGTTGMIGDYAKAGWEAGPEMRAVMDPVLKAVGAAAGMSAEEQRWHMDRAAAKFVSVQEQVGPVVVYPDDDDAPPCVFEGGVEAERG